MILRKAGAADMAQSGIFHTSMRGFNKEEVLQYIEDLNVRTTAEQQAATEEVAQKQQENTELRAKLAACQEELVKAEQNAEQLQQLVDQYRGTVRQMNDAVAQVESLNREKLALNASRVRAEQLATEQTARLEQREKEVGEWQASAKALSAQLDEAKRENEALRSRLQNAVLTPEKRRYYERLEDTCRQAVEENRRYRALIGHVGTFVAEVQQMNRGMLGDTCRQGADALAKADGELETAIAQLTASRSTLAELQAALSDRWKANDERLSALCERLSQDIPTPEEESAE